MFLKASGKYCRTTRKHLGGGFVSRSSRIMAEQALANLYYFLLYLVLCLRFTNVYLLAAKIIRTLYGNVSILTSGGFERNELILDLFSIHRPQIAFSCGRIPVLTFVRAATRRPVRKTMIVAKINLIPAQPVENAGA